MQHEGGMVCRDRGEMGHAKQMEDDRWGQRGGGSCDTKGGWSVGTEGRWVMLIGAVRRSVQAGPFPCEDLRSDFLW